jgi:hypothetical protein
VDAARRLADLQRQLWDSNTTLVSSPHRVAAHLALPPPMFSYPPGSPPVAAHHHLVAAARAGAGADSSPLKQQLERSTRALGQLSAQLGERDAALAAKEAALAEAEVELAAARAAAGRKVGASEIVSAVGDAFPPSPL